MGLRKILLSTVATVMAVGIVACSSDESNEAVTQSNASEMNTGEAMATSAEDKANIESIVKYIENVDECIEDTVEILAEPLDDSDDGIDKKVNDLEDIYNEIKKIKKEIDKLPDEAGAEEIQKTYEVAKKYFEELDNDYGDLIEINDYFLKVTKAVDKYMDFSDDYADIQSQAIGVTNQIATFTEKLKKIESPEYIVYTHEYVIEQMSNYVLVLQDMVDAIEKEDVLQLVSAEYLNYYVEEQFSESIGYLSEDMDIQYDKFQKHLEERAKIYQEELLENCEKQLDKAVAVKYTFYDEEKMPSIEYTYEDKIYPATYSVLESVVKMKATCEQGECDVLLKVEIPDFAVEYEQKLTLGSQFTQLYIKPVIDTGANFDSQKTVQMKITIEDADSGKVYVKESNNITIMSKYDLELFTPGSEDGSCYNVLAWMTPEDDVITKVKREAIEFLTEASDGQITGLYGYQMASNLTEGWDYTEVEALAVMRAISNMGVRYNMDGYSASTEGDTLQRVMYPADVIENESGLCIETSLLVASVMQSMGYNCMLVFPPNHCFVAVEVYPGSGEYLRIETTAIPAQNYELSQYLMRWTPEEWLEYIKNAPNGAGQPMGCTVVDCNLGKEIGILPYNE